MFLKHKTYLLSALQVCFLTDSYVQHINTCNVCTRNNSDLVQMFSNIKYKYKSMWRGTLWNSDGTHITSVPAYDRSLLIYIVSGILLWWEAGQVYSICMSEFQIQIFYLPSQSWDIFRAMKLVRCTLPITHKGMGYQTIPPLYTLSLPLNFVEQFFRFEGARPEKGDNIVFSVPILQDNGIKMASFLSNPEIVPLYNI